MFREVPNIITEVGFDFHWSEEKVWKLDLPIESMDVQDLTWHFEIPFWSTPNGYYDLKPNDVINHPERYPEEYQRILKADCSYPLDIMHWKQRWLLLDGLHRLVKLAIERKTVIKVRKVPLDSIPLIKK